MTILKETDKAVNVEIVLCNPVTGEDKYFTIWCPKSCIDENGNIKGWFLKNKIQELNKSKWYFVSVA